MVTGGAGFVGRHFVKRICSDYTVIIVDDLSSESAIHPDVWPPHLKCSDAIFIRLDCRTFFIRQRKFYKDISLFVHLAAVVGGRSKIEGDPAGIALSDLSIDWRLFSGRF